MKKAPIWPSFWRRRVRRIDRVGAAVWKVFGRQEICFRDLDSLRMYEEAAERHRPLAAAENAFGPEKKARRLSCVSVCVCVCVCARIRKRTETWKSG